jgi:hypothetical protein
MMIVFQVIKSFLKKALSANEQADVEIDKDAK